MLIFTKYNTNSKVHALLRIRLSKQLCFLVFCKSRLSKPEEEDLILTGRTFKPLGLATAKDAAGILVPGEFAAGILPTGTFGAEEMCVDGCFSATHETHELTGGVKRAGDT